MRCDRDLPGIYCTYTWSTSAFEVVVLPEPLLYPVVTITCTQSKLSPYIGRNSATDSGPRSTRTTAPRGHADADIVAENERDAGRTVLTWVSTVGCETHTVWHTNENDERRVVTREFTTLT